MTVTGLGYFEARINGKKLGNEYFQPVVSDYEPLDTQSFFYPISDTTFHRVYYRVFNLVSFLKSGDNCLEIQLGGGWYTQNERTCEGTVRFGENIKCIYTLQLGEQTLYSDGSEQWRDSDIKYSNVYLGERHDPTADKNSGTVQCLPDTETVFFEQIGTPDRLIRTLAPKYLGNVNGRKAGI